MLPISFDEISSDHILNLVQNKVQEHKTLEYKEKLSIVTGDDKCEFLSDISSFTNASGGDILFGISDERDEGGRATGLPAKIVGIAADNTSTVKARIEQIIESGVQPRIPGVQVKVIEVPSKGTVLLVRIPRSWISPHMVTHSNRSRFYSRNSSTGKMQLDVQQIGSAFAQQRSLGERLSQWKANRISKSVSGEGPVVLQGSRLLFHFVSASALLEDRQAFPRIFQPETWGLSCRLMSFGADVERYNADGFLIVSPLIQEKLQSYLQVFRDGTLEYGDSYVLDSSGATHIESRAFEEKLARTFTNAMYLLMNLEVPEPVFVTLSLLDVKGRTMTLPASSYIYGSTSHPFDRDVVLCPDVLIPRMKGELALSPVLLPIINAVWQAAGREKTPYLDANGSWRILS